MISGLMETIQRILLEAVQYFYERILHCTLCTVDYTHNFKHFIYISKLDIVSLETGILRPLTDQTLFSPLFLLIYVNFSY